jgi:hypothetical protein
MNLAATSVVLVGDTNNYLVGGNVCNAFCLGEPCSQDDFFLVGAEPEPAAAACPLVTGNLLDAAGQVLCRLVRNQIADNPGECTLRRADGLGYEISDRDGQLVLGVRSEWLKLPILTHSCFVTTLSGRFYDRHGGLVLDAAGGRQIENVAEDAKLLMGFTGDGFLVASNTGPEDLSLAVLAVTSHGSVHRVLEGAIEDRNVLLDGALLRDAQLRNCTVLVSSGNFFFRNVTEISGCNFVFDGEAATVRDLLQLLGQAN